MPFAFGEGQGSFYWSNVLSAGVVQDPGYGAILPVIPVSTLAGLVFRRFFKKTGKKRLVGKRLMPAWVKFI